MAIRLLYSKCRPQGCDAWQIAKDFRRVFVGYPVASGDLPVERWREHGCKRVLRDFADPAWEPNWTAGYEKNYRAQVTANRRLARELDAGSFVIVPRPGEGVCHVAELIGRFEVVDRPAWADPYFELRRERGLSFSDESSHIGDISQSWPTGPWHTVSFPAIPRWITYRLLSRNTIGLVEDLDQRTSSVKAVRNLLANDVRGPVVTSNVEHALINGLSPATFEHLVVALLQLESGRDLFWHHIGGSGDGGADGICVDRAGRLQGLLQCKWYYAGDPWELHRSMDQHAARRVVAILHGRTDVAERRGDDVLWTRRHIAELVQKHAARLPLAGSLGLWHADQLTIG